MVISFDKIVEKYNLKVKGVLHIGAHWGQEYTMYAKHNIENMVFFEPVDDAYKKLLEKLPDNPKIITFNIALGNKTGVMDMYVETANDGQSCSLLEPNVHLIQYPHIKFNNKCEVRIDKLDNIPIDRYLYNMINIDVQGYELEVFKGGKDVLNHIDIVYTEVNRDDVYANCARVEEIDAFLAEHEFHRVETDWAGETWGDALYLKK